jgi:hypothetical protein
VFAVKQLVGKLHASHGVELFVDVHGHVSRRAAHSRTNGVARPR